MLLLPHHVPTRLIFLKNYCFSCQSHTDHVLVGDKLVLKCTQCESKPKSRKQNRKSLAKSQHATSSKSQAQQHGKRNIKPALKSLKYCKYCDKNTRHTNGKCNISHNLLRKVITPITIENERDSSTNTGECYITKTESSQRFNVSIPCPHTPRKRHFKSVGYGRLGESKGLKKAVKVRNELGKELWGVHWKTICDQPHLLKRLPKTLEPTYKPEHWVIRKSDGEKVLTPIYVAKWFNPATGLNETTTAKIETHGRLTAYTITKRALLTVYKNYLPLIRYMGRVEHTTV